MHGQQNIKISFYANFSLNFLSNLLNHFSRNGGVHSQFDPHFSAADEFNIRGL